MSLDKRIFIAEGGYKTLSPFQNNVAAGGYNSSTSYPNGYGCTNAELNANLTGNIIWTTACTVADIYNFGNNGSSRSNNQIIMTMAGPTTTNGLTSAGRSQSYYHYTGVLKWYGSNDGSNWTELTSHSHSGSSLSISCQVLSSSYTASTWSYYKVDITAGNRGTYGGFSYLAPSVVT